MYSQLENAHLFKNIGTFIDRQQSSSSLAKISFNRLVDLNSNLSAKGLSKDSVDIITASWRESTIKQYQYAWKLWSTWCVSICKDPIDSNVPDLLNVLRIQITLHF